MKKNCRIASTLVLVLLMVSLSSNSAWAWSDMKVLEVDQRNQESVQTCWAACEQMVLLYFGINKTQDEIILTIYNPIQYIAAYYGDVATSLDALGVGNTRSGDRVPFNGVMSNIYNNQPIMAGVIFRDYGTVWAHMGVISGFFAIEDGSFYWHDVYWVDPSTLHEPYSWINYDSLEWTFGSIYNTYRK